MSTETSTSAEMSEDLQRSSRYLLGVGAVIAVLGLLAILAPFVTGIGLSILLGALLVVGGLAHAINAFGVRGWTGSLWQIVLAILYTVAGISLLANPVLGLATLTILLVVYLAIEGATEVVMGIGMRSQSHWVWAVVSGLVSLALAGLLWAGFPSTALWAVGLLVGVSLLSTGVMLVVVGYRNRQASAAAGETPRGEAA